MHVHLVFVTKYRRHVFTKQILSDLKTIFSSVCQDFNATLEEMEGEQNHVHLLINYPPKQPISKLVNSLKGVSSRLIRKKDIPQSVRPCGEITYGLRAILLDLAEELRYQ